MGTTPVFRNRSWATQAQAQSHTTTTHSTFSTGTSSTATGNNGHNNSNNTRNYQRTNRPSRAPPRNNKPAASNLRGRCDVCCTKFSFFGRKRTCTECGKTVCPSCLEGPETPTSDERPRCRRCQLLASVPRDPDRLMDMHVRDLRTILNALGVASHTCCEKTELVELVLVSCGAADAKVPQRLDQRVPDEAGEPGTDFIETLNSNVVHVEPASEEPDGGPVEMQTGTEEENDVDAVEDIGLNSEDTGEVAPARLEPVAEEEEVAVPVGGRRLMLRDLASEEDIEMLGVQQLKGLLLRSSVDYRGCCEKWELVDRTKRLWRENKENVSTLKDDDMCRICMDAPIDCVLLECGHMATCTNCGRLMNECPFCRQYVIRAVHIFRA